MAFHHELSETGVVPAAQGLDRLLRAEYLRHHVPRPPEHGPNFVAAAVALRQRVQILLRRLPQALLPQRLGGRVAVPATTRRR